MKDLSDFCPEFQEAAAYYASLNTPSDQAILVEFLRETQPNSLALNVNAI